MDHLPRVRNPTFQLPLVPYLEDGRFAYSGPFETFGSRNQFTYIAENEHERRHAYSSFVQNWLYFGLLQAFFAIWSLPVSILDFVEETKDGRMVTSTLLQDYLVALVAFEHERHSLLMRDKRPANEVRGYNSKEVGAAHHRISQAHEILQKHHDILQCSINKSDVEPAIWDSIVLLGATISRAKDVIFRPVFNLSSKGISQQVLYSDFRLRSMPDFRMNEKWCRHERKVIAALVDERLPELVFLGQLDRSEPESMHVHCKDNECIAYQIKEQSTYRTRHVEDGCSCDFVGFDIGKFSIGHDVVGESSPTELKLENGTSLKEEEKDDGASEISKSLSGMIWDTLPKNWTKKVPAITFVEGKLEHHEIPLAQAQTAGLLGFPITGWNLVAISHVWADGLGNPDENKLPTCQLERLQSLVNGLYKERKQPIPFWIDTLMIPVFPEPFSDEQRMEQKQIKNAALRDMEWIYKGASKVLVLDRGLLPVTTSGMHVEEIGARIMVSAWSRRLWTLQEGCSKERVLFQFQDQAVSWPKLHDEVKSGSKLSTWKDLSRLPKKHPVRKAQKVKKFKWTRNVSKNEFEGSSPYLQAVIHADKRLFKVTNQVWHSILSFLQEMTVDWSGGLKGEPLARCMRAMYYRNCSHPEDEPLVLTSLLSWRPGSAANLTKDEASMGDPVQKQDRYKRLFRELKYVPLDMLFLDQRRYEDYGSGWIPKSLLSTNTAFGKPIARTEHIPKAYNINNLFRVRKASPMCEISEHGLVTGLDGLQISPRPTALKAPFWIEHDGKRWEVHLHHPGTDQELFDFVEADWVLIPEQAIAVKSDSCQAILAQVLERHKHRSGGRTRFAALATLMQFREPDHLTPSVSHGKDETFHSRRKVNIVRKSKMAVLNENWIIG